VPLAYRTQPHDKFRQRSPECDQRTGNDQFRDAGLYGQLRNRENEHLAAENDHQQAQEERGQQLADGRCRITQNRFAR